MSDNYDEEYEFTHIPGWELDKGQQRENNEDNLRAFKLDTTKGDSKRSLGIYVVADGIGGEIGGEKASELAVETVMHEMRENITDKSSAKEVVQWLANSASKAHQAILSRKKAHEAVGGTTLVMATVIANRVYIANIGDSRAYILHKNQLRQITQDHTVAQKFVDAGVITQEEAAEHPLSHVLFHAVGSEEEEEVLPDMFIETVQHGDYVMLCTDGLYNAVSPANIAKIIKDAATPSLASQRLTKAANDAGGPDNIAVIVVEIRQRV
jgi:PPM family protein phosphatase